MNENNFNNDINTLIKSINEIKNKLNTSVSLNELLLENTLQLSQELDKLIVQYYKHVKGIKRK